MNMIIHRDYRSSADSIVKVFNDKIEFYNPGKLPDDISVEDLHNNTYNSNPRNKLIADLFKDWGHIEKYGSGIKRIMNLFKKENLSIPEFKNISGGFMVTVFKDVTENRLLLITNLTKQDAYITTTRISEILNVTRRTIARDIDYLKNKIN